MNALEQLSEAFRTLASLPDAINKARQEQFGNIQTLEATIETLNRKVEELSKRIELVDHLNDNFADSLSRMAVSMADLEVKWSGPYEFNLENDDEGYADDSWDRIIKHGQEVQQPFWEEGEQRWNRELGPSPKGIGWYGSVSMPIITIRLTEPEYKFRNTKRLPGRFALRSISRWGQAFRCDGKGDKVIKDSIGYGHCYNEPIGIYVEPATELPSGMIVRPFEQDIRDCLIVGTNNVLPIYVAQNPDRLHIVGNNIQQHGGGFFGIKHGPAYAADWMPKPARIVDDVYLGDTVISGNQFEGPHRMTHRTGSRRQAAIFFGGNNVQVRDNNFYGWSHCVYSHGGQGRVVTGNTAHHGDTADGRSWAKKDELVMCLLSCTQSLNPDAIGMNAGGFKEWVLQKGSRVPSAGGWHAAEERCL